MAGAARVGAEKGHTVWTHCWDDAPVMPVEDQDVMIPLGFNSTEVLRKYQQRMKHFSSKRGHVFRQEWAEKVTPHIWCAGRRTAACSGSRGRAREQRMRTILSRHKGGEAAALQ